MAEEIEGAREEKRRRILKTAAREFVSRGFGGANINVIAERSGVGKGTIYLYFESKADLFNQALKESNKLFMRRAGEVVEGRDNPLDALRELLKMDVILGVEHQELAQLWISSFFGENRRFAGSAVEVLEEYADLVEGLVERCIDEGLLREVDPRLATYILLGMNEITIAFYEPLLSGMGGIEGVYRDIQDTILKGLIK
ncbi:MAG: TetR/AcrR family transcriptional regulator [Actinomycetota bacterium]|nr:TetR/AcrR family transcriptional regulator [Actinomycetota bacterium]